MQVGDRVFYPMHGAGVISGVESCEVLGENKDYFVLKMPMGNLKVMIPQDNVEKGQCLALMLVVISFTTSAKAGSERIWVSTLSSECRTVV